MKLVAVDPDDQQDQAQTPTPIKGNGFTLIPAQDSGARSAESQATSENFTPSTGTEQSKTPDFISNILNLLGGAENKGPLKPNYPADTDYSNPYAAATAKSFEDLNAIPAAAINQMGFNFPRAISHMAGYQYPAPNWQIMNPGGAPTNKDYQPTAPAATIASNLAGLFGLTKSPFNAMANIKPITGAGVVPAIANKALGGAAIGATYSPDNTLNVPQRAQGAGIGAFLAPLLEMAVPAAGKAVGTGVRKLANIPSESIQKLREIGAPKVFQPNMARPEYPTQELRPQVEKMVKNEAVQMNPATLRELGLDNETIDHLGKMTPDEMNAARFGGSLGDLSFDVRNELGKKVAESEKNFRDTLNDIPEGQRLKLNNFRKELSHQLKGMFKGGKLRSDIPKSDLKPISELFDMYQDKRQIMDKGAFLRRLDRLNHIIATRGGAPEGARAQALKEALYQDAVDFGFKGLKEARDSYRAGKEFEPFMKEAKFSSRKIARELTPEDRLRLQRLEEYIGKPIIKPAQHINAISEFDEFIKNLSSDKTKLGKKIDSILSKVQGEGYYSGKEPMQGQAAEELTRLLGNKAKADAVLKNITSNRINQDFQTQGFHATHSGIIQGGAKAIAKTFEQALPGVVDFPKNLTRILEEQTPTIRKGASKIASSAEDIAESLKKKLSDEKGWITLSTKQPDMYKYNPAKPTDLKMSDGKPVEKFVYDTEKQRIAPIYKGDVHKTTAFGEPVNNIKFDEMIRGINKGNVIYLRPSGSQKLLESAIYGEGTEKMRAWNYMREHQLQAAEVLTKDNPGKTIILAGGGPNSDLPKIETASDIPDNAEKLVDSRYIYKSRKSK